MDSDSPLKQTPLEQTPLWALHQELGGRMTPFAGWDMPVRYHSTIAEHEATRTSAGLFDIGHMAVVDVAALVNGAGDAGNANDAAAWLESLVPASISGLTVGQMAYTVLTTPDGGIIDDLVVSHMGDCLRVVLNASRTDADLSHLRSAASASTGSGDSAGSETVVTISPRTDLAMLALQGPAAVGVLSDLGVDINGLTFMQRTSSMLGGVECDISRSGYTGEDGFELTIPVEAAEAVARALLADPKVTPVGLAARDSLRLEAGLCLYGKDLDETTSPVEAGLRWSIPPNRRNADGGYPGADVIAQQIADGVSRRRVGIAAAGRRPIRDGATLYLADGTDVDQNKAIGHVTSGGHGPSVGRPIAMGYVRADCAKPGTELTADVRGRREPCKVERMPFVKHKYQR